LSCLEQSEQIEYEKMMLDDVVSDIKQVIVTKENLNETSKVVIELDNYNIKNLQEADNPSHKTSLILQQFFQKDEKILTYKGKTKIRRDVLNRFRRISESLKRNENYPNGIDRKILENCVGGILGEVDHRVYDEYVKSIDMLTNSEYNEYDVRHFILAVDTTQHHSTSS